MISAKQTYYYLKMCSRYFAIDAFHEILIQILEVIVEIDPKQITLTYSIQAAYEGEIVQVKYGNKLVASFERDNPERFVTFDSGTSMIWLTKELFLALHAQVCLEFFQMRTSVFNFEKHHLLEQFISFQDYDFHSTAQKIPDILLLVSY